MHGVLYLSDSGRLYFMFLDGIGTFQPHVGIKHTADFNCALGLPQTLKQLYCPSWTQLSQAVKATFRCLAFMHTRHGSIAETVLDDAVRYEEVQKYEATQHHHQLATTLLTTVDTVTIPSYKARLENKRKGRVHKPSTMN